MNERSSRTSPRWQPQNRFPLQRVTLPAAALPEGTRRRILEAALQLFASKGFHGVSVRELAKELKLQPSALYAHLPSKEHILAELARLGHELHQTALRTALLSAGAEPAEQLRALVRANATLHATHPQLAIVANEELHALPYELAAPALELRQQSSALLLDVIGRGVALGRFSCPSPLVTAAAIGAMGLRIPYWYQPTAGLAIDTLADLQAELALRMLGAA
jgi:AcrR family transcriptional regulator